MYKRILSNILFLLVVSTVCAHNSGTVFSKRQMEFLDRGLVAVRTSPEEVFI
jgi:hypothetical protein